MKIKYDVTKRIKNAVLLCLVANFAIAAKYKIDNRYKIGKIKRHFLSIWDSFMKSACYLDSNFSEAHRFHEFYFWEAML